MMCPNHHREEAQTGTVSDGVYLRPVLACGCTPTHEDTNTRPVSAALPYTAPSPAELADEENTGTRSHLEIMVEQILRAKGLFE